MKYLKAATCLQANERLLGVGYSNLGKTIGFGFLGPWKVFLSYDRKTGWKVLKLNFIQLFFRKILGAYKTTHLNHIVNHWNKRGGIDEGDVEKCHARIQGIWTKKYLIGVGNAKFSQADVICFAEEHLDRSYRASVAEFINANYREGDIVLVEGVEAGKIAPKEHPQTRDVKVDCVIRGWEVENFEELSSAAKEANAKHKLLTASLKRLKEVLPPKGELNSEQLTTLEREVEDLAKNIRILSQYYKKNDAGFAVEAVEAIYRLFRELKKGTLSSEGAHGSCFLYAVSSILMKLEKRREKALHENISPRQFEEIVRHASQRNASLIEEIAKCRREGKRVFAIAGEAHFLQFPSRDKSNRALQQALQNYKFIIIARKEKFLPKLNPHLTESSKKLL